ncbi:retrotransposon protein, putative, ty1-copia subclass [Tanacetum coccineum]
MKNYVELECLGYVLPQELKCWFNLEWPHYNKHNMGKTVGELHAMLIEYEKGLPKKAETPQVMMIKSGKIQKSNKKSLKAKAKDDTCHHCKEVGHCKRNCPAYLAELIKKKKQVGIASSSDVFIIELFSFTTKSWVYDTSCDNCHYAPSILRGVVSVHRLVENGFVQRFTDFGISVSKNNVYYSNAIPSNGIYEIDMHDLVPNINSIYNVSTKRAKHNLDSTYLWHCRLTHISKKRIEKQQQEGLLKSTDDESFDQCVSCLSGKMTRELFPYRPKRATDLLGIIYTDVCGPLRHVSRKGARRNRTLLDMVRSMMNLTTLSLSFWDYALESATRILNMVPTKNVNKTPYELWQNLIEVEGFEPPQKEEIPIRRSERTRRAPDRLCLNIDAMNAEIQSMMDNMVWVLVDLPPSCKPVRKTFSPVADIRAIIILISIAACYDYEIWQMDVKTAFLNGYLDEDIYMVQPKGFVDPNHPRKVCKLQRSIYGLKQASRSWNKRFDEEIKRFGFSQNLDEPCVYQKASGSNITFLIFYVDDIIIMGNHIPSLQSVKDYLGKCFSMKDLGEAAFILGIKIYRDRYVFGLWLEIRIAEFELIAIAMLIVIVIDDMKLSDWICFVLMEARRLERLQVRDTEMLG